MVAVAGLSASKSFLLGSLLAVLALWATLSPVAQAQDFVELPPELDARAAQLYDGIMCPICNGQTISQSNSEIASNMRQMVRERLLDGDTNEQIYAFMANAFGEDILASPPTSGASLAVWVIPPIAVLLGLAAVGFAINRLRRGASEPQVPAGTAPATVRSEDRYLAMVDREMGENR